MARFDPVPKQCPDRIAVLSSQSPRPRRRMRLEQISLRNEWCRRPAKSRPGRNETSRQSAGQGLDPPQIRPARPQPRGSTPRHHLIHARELAAMRVHMDSGPSASSGVFHVKQRSRPAPSRASSCPGGPAGGSWRAIPARRTGGGCPADTGAPHAPPCGRQAW